MKINSQTLFKENARPRGGAGRGVPGPRALPSPPRHSGTSSRSLSPPRQGFSTLSETFGTAWERVTADASQTGCAGTLGRGGRARSSPSVRTRGDPWAGRWGAGGRTTGVAWWRGDGGREGPSRGATSCPPPAPDGAGAGAGSARRAHRKPRPAPRHFRALWEAQRTRWRTRPGERLGGPSSGRLGEVARGTGREDRPGGPGRGADLGAACAWSCPRCWVGRAMGTRP